jgi:hypothetical protein
MTLGLASGTANSLLNTLRGTSFSVAATFVKLHTGDPGAAGTANASANTTRPSITFAAAAAGSMAMNNTPTWASWASGPETITHISLWDAATAGTFLWSGALAASKAVANGDTFTLTTCTASFTAIAA